MPRTSDPTTLTPQELDELAAAVAADGAASHESALRRLAVAVRIRLGPARRTDVAVDVMLDPSAPEVVRSRAFGLVSAALVAAPPASTTRRHDLAA